MIRCHNVRARKGERERGRENDKNHHPPMTYVVVVTMDAAACMSRSTSRSHVSFHGSFGHCGKLLPPPPPFPLGRQLAIPLDTAHQHPFPTPTNTYCAPSAPPGK